jgi:hypothetical protein
MKEERTEKFMSKKVTSNSLSIVRGITFPGSLIEREIGGC